MVYIDTEHKNGEELFVLCENGSKTVVEHPYKAIEVAVTRKYELQAKHKNGISKARFEHKEDVLKWLKTFKSDQMFLFNGERCYKVEIESKLEDSVKPTCAKCQYFKKAVIDGHRQSYCAIRTKANPTSVDKIIAAFKCTQFYNKGWEKTHTDCHGEFFEAKVSVK